GTLLLSAPARQLGESWSLCKVAAVSLPAATGAPALDRRSALSGDETPRHVAKGKWNAGQEQIDEFQSLEIPVEREARQGVALIERVERQGPFAGRHGRRVSGGLRQALLARADAGGIAIRIGEQLHRPSKRRLDGAA